MEPLLNLGLTNALTAAFLALAAATIARFTRRPALWYALWLVVLLRLLAPPIFAVDFPLPDLGRAGLDSTTTTAVAVTGGAVTPFDTGSTIDLVTILIATWALGGIAVIGLAIVQSIRLRRILAAGNPAPAAFNSRITEIARALGLNRPPLTVMVADRVPPMLWAFLGRVRLILPIELLDRLSSDETDTLLAHELAHLSRRDHLARHLELAASALFWWHPVAWWAAHRLRRAQELCCDQRVAELLPTHRRAYADCLVETARFLSGHRLPLGSPARAMADMSQMKGRIRVIMTTAPDRRMSLSTKLLATVVLVAAIAVTPILTATPDEPEFTGDPISLSLLDADLNDVLASISKVTNVEILIEPGITGKVTAEFKAVPWDEALAGILEEQALIWEHRNGLIIVRKGNIAQAGLTLPPEKTFESTTITDRIDGQEVFQFREGGDYSQPKVIHYEPPHYPPEMRKAGISGPVVASLLIDKTGIVREVEIVKSPADELSAAATEAVQQWVFEPATKDGKPVAVRFMVTVMFRLK